MLTDKDREVLDLERDWWHSAPTKQAAIAARLGCSPTAYYAVLRRLTTNDEALAYDPLVVRRVRRRLVRHRRSAVEGVAQWRGPR